MKCFWRRLFILFSMLPAFAGSSFAQDTLRYFVDYGGIKCAQQSAYCYRLAAKEDSLWHIQSYYLPEGEMQMEGQFWDEEATKPQDTIVRYHKNGETESIEIYKDGKLDGLRLAYDTVGQPLDSCYYKNGQPSSYHFSWNTDGLLTEFGDYDEEGKGTGMVWHYHDNTKLCCYGKRSAGNAADGPWTFYYDDGSVSTHETYVRGKLKKRVCYDPADSTSPVKCKDAESASKAFKKEIETLLAAQTSTMFGCGEKLVDKKGRLVVDVCVEIDGQVTSTIIQPFDPCVDYHVTHALGELTVPVQVKHNRYERTCEVRNIDFQ
ncbi:toxin-antitoxin system YwqK family antitoxin [Polluticoccus soli]|uniref:toxin-antitoxin system YwqK family antitoxin n=1 Tax=Polluticoccus soli TaxID=3034150 RepID=UPI0023E2BDD1|nr:hypothetical protein [Flavipsychrobacter sp. JY13-12]